MSKKDLTIVFSVEKAAKDVFDAVNNVTAWWTENLKGSSRKLNDEFSVQFWDLHYSKQKLVEVIPNKKVVWLVTDSKLTFLKNQQEWTNTTISFEISEKDNKTQLTFIHHGLFPDIECYADCSTAWTGYIKNSLRDLITKGKGKPEKKE